MTRIERAILALGVHRQSASGLASRKLPRAQIQSLAGQVLAVHANQSAVPFHLTAYHLTSVATVPLDDLQQAVDLPNPLP